jgi:hypothetical protein
MDHQQRSTLTSYLEDSRWEIVFRNGYCKRYLAIEGILCKAAVIIIGEDTSLLNGYFMSD